MTSRPQFLILDQSLLDADGHHYDMDRHVARAAKQLGMTPRVAAHRHFDMSLPFDETPVDPWFTQTWVDAHQSKTVQAARRIIQSTPRSLQAPLLSPAGLARRWCRPKLMRPPDRRPLSRSRRLHFRTERRTQRPRFHTHACRRGTSFSVRGANRPPSRARFTRSASQRG